MDGNLPNQPDLASTVREIVMQLLANPAVRSLQQGQGSRELTEPSQESHQPGPSCPSSSLPCQPATTMNSELRRCFSSKKRPSAVPRTLAKKSKKERTITKNVVLLDRGMTSIPTDRSDLYRNGRIVNCFKWTTSHSTAEMVDYIRELFPNKLENLPKPGFQIVKADRNKFFFPQLPPNAILDGETISSLCGHGQLYIMATGDILDGYDSTLYRDEDASDSEPYMGEIQVDDNNFNTPTLPSAQCSVNLVRLENTDRIATSSTLSSHDLSTLVSNSHNLSVAASHTHDSPQSHFDVTDFVPIDFFGDEDAALEEALKASMKDLQDSTDQNKGGNLPRVNFNELTAEATSGIISAHSDRFVKGPKRNITVSRRKVWETSLPYFERRAFIAQMGLVVVEFTGGDEDEEEDEDGETIKDGQIEDACDMGGPRREFFRLLRHAIIQDSGLVEESPNGMVIRPCFASFSKGKYMVMGQMFAMMIVQGGEAPALFSPSLTDYVICGDILTIRDPDIDDVPDKRVRDDLNKILDAKDDADMMSTMAQAEWRFDIPGLPGVARIGNRDIFVKEVILHFSVFRSKAMVDQFIEGLKYYDVLEQLRKHPGMRGLFQKCNKELTAKELINLLRPKYSVRNRHRKEQEELVMASLKKVLFKIKDNELDDLLEGQDENILTDKMKEFAGQLNISNILAFVTGAASRPVTGFSPRPSIRFVHDNTKHAPTCSTCSNELQLYVNELNKDPNKLVIQLLTSLMNGRVFSTI